MDGNGQSTEEIQRAIKHKKRSSVSGVIGEMQAKQR